MSNDSRIANLRRRIQSHLGRPPGRTDPEPTLDGLERDIAALEAATGPTANAAAADTGSSAEITREQAVFRAVAESIVEGLVVADMAGNFIMFNTAAQRLLGREPTYPLKESSSDAFGVYRVGDETPCPPEEIPLVRALHGEFVDDEEFIRKAPEGPALNHFLVNARPVTDTEAQQLGAVAVLHDVTEARTAEGELRTARRQAEEALQVKSEFLANMSHEIRTPLTAVLGFADLLLDPSSDESQKLNYIQAIRRNGEHLLGLVNDILDLSKIQAQKMQVESVRCSLHQLIHKAASVMQVRAHDKGLDFNVVSDTPIPEIIESDALRVQQILFNLLSNAVKFTRTGRVELRARCHDLNQDRASVELDVTDTGVGMTTDEIAALFQPFHQANLGTTRQFGGTGLGLAICKSLAEALGGEIRVASVPGSGSTFTFRFPQPVDADTAMIERYVGQSEALASSDPAFEDPDTLAGHVLLAEDGTDNQVLIRTILERQGLDVAIAANGEIAVAEAIQALTDDCPYDLILMDMQMPKLDGYAATATLRRKGYSGPIVVLTAHAAAGERERCLAAGCDDYLTKPIARSALIAAVKSHLNRIRGGVIGLESQGEETVATSTAEAPLLYSSYADDPDMADLIAGFVSRLPE